MKIRSILFPSIVVGFVAGNIISGCSQKGQDFPTVTSLEKDTIVYLEAGQTEPSCKVKINYEYLQPVSPTDSITPLINSHIQDMVFGNQYANLSPQTFVQKLCNDFLATYNTDIKSLFEADKKTGLKGNDIPTWYNYEFEVKSKIESGLDSIWTCDMTIFQYTGGAHPSTLLRTVNIDGITGKPVTAEDVFLAGKDWEIIQLIMKELIKETNIRMETDTITCLDGLHEAGILLDTELYIPENFLLKKDGITFIYNQYDIAPYVVGNFRLTVPYNDIEPYLKIKKTS